MVQLTAAADDSESLKCLLYSAQITRTSDRQVELLLNSLPPIFTRVHWMRMHPKIKTSMLHPET